MKKITIILLISILTVYGGILPAYAAVTSEINYSGLNDAQLHQLIRDNIYATLESEYESEDLIIENISTTYISKEYLEEFAYNSKANVFFGYTLAELDEQFQGQRFVFTLGDDGKTVVKAYETLDNSVYNTIIKNVLVGSGIILICVTASLVTAGGATAPISMIFAASARTASTMALSGGVIGGISNGLITGIQTGDFDKALEAAALGASEGFKVGAISGALVGGAKEAYSFHSASLMTTSNKIPTWQQSEARVQKIYGGNNQVSYLNGQELIGRGTSGATRPDVVRTVSGHLEGIEVKNYDLINNNYQLVSEITREVSNRVVHMPAGSTQRIVLDVAGRGYTNEIVDGVIDQIVDACADIYPYGPIPVDVLSW